MFMYFQQFLFRLELHCTDQQVELRITWIIRWFCADMVRMTWRNTKVSSPIDPLASQTARLKRLLTIYSFSSYKPQCSVAERLSCIETDDVAISMGPETMVSGHSAQCPQVQMSMYSSYSLTMLNQTEWHEKVLEMLLQFIFGVR